jgi:adenylylsulfate kinase
MARELSYLRLLEVEAVFVMREVAAEFESLTGIDDPYEAPAEPDLVLDGTQPLQEGVERLEALLSDRGLL